MSFIIGTISRNVSKNNKEFFVGKINGLPVRGAWSKKENVEQLCLFLDLNQINYLSEDYEKKKAQTAAAQGENKEQPV